MDRRGFLALPAMLAACRLPEPERVGLKDAGPYYADCPRYYFISEKYLVPIVQENGRLERALPWRAVE